jgi:hypothetical protein
LAIRTSIPTEIYAAAPSQLATTVHQQEGDMVRTFDGRQGYFLLPLTVVEVYPWTAGANEGAKLDAEMAFPGTDQTGVDQLARRLLDHGRWQRGARRSGAPVRRDSSGRSISTRNPGC